MELNCENAVTWWRLDILILIVNYHSQPVTMALMGNDICKVQTLIVIFRLSNNHPAFSGVHVALSLVFCVMVCRSLFVLFLCYCKFRNYCIHLLLRFSKIFTYCDFLLLRSMKSSSTNGYVWFRNARFIYCNFTSVAFFAIIKTSQ